MSDIVHNIAKGKFAEWCERVNANDPANAALIVALVAATGVETDAVLRDLDDFTALVAGATNFATNTNGGRKTIDQAGGITVVHDDTNDWTLVDIPDQTWTAVANDGTGAIGDVEIGYDSDTTAGTDANIKTGTLHDFPITPDGSDITAQTPNGIFKAS